MKLFEWTKEYIKFKDMLKKQNTSVDYFDNKIIVTQKDNKINYLIDDNLNNIIKDIEDIKEIYLVCLNTKKNVDVMEDNWKILTQNPKLTIIFVEPDLNVKWLIKPHIHNKIIDGENLKEGLLSLHRGIKIN